jgi:hypothetical protein
VFGGGEKNCWLQQNEGEELKMSFSRVWVGSVEKVVAGVVGWVVTRKREPLMMELLGGAVVTHFWVPTKYI